MHPQLQQWHDAFLQLRDEVHAFADSQPSAVFNTPPAAGRWSAAQCIVHLNVAGTLLADKLEPALDSALEQGITGAPPFPLGITGRLFVRALEPGGRKLQTPGTYEPPRADNFVSRYEVAAAFADLQQRLARMTQKGETLDFRRIRVASPVSKWLRFNAAAWLAATLAHEQRHLLQAREAVKYVTGA